MEREVSVVILDMDNTLYDWFTMWRRSFGAMLDELVRRSGIDQQILESEIQCVFRKHNTSEYPHVIQELPSLQAKHPGKDLTVMYQGSIDAYRKARSETLRLYPGVQETMITLREQGCRLVVLTESTEYHAVRRAKMLGLDELVHYFIYFPDHWSQPGSPQTAIARFGSGAGTQITKNICVNGRIRKPDRKLLEQTIMIAGARVEQTIYIGDKLHKDILMAQDASVIDVHAKYGDIDNPQGYAQLRRVSHWDDEEIERELAIQESREVTPTYVLEDSFKELLNIFKFVPCDES